MNLYDIKQVCCIKCGKFVGEIEVDVQIAYIVCNNCQNLGVNNQNDPNQKNLPENVTRTHKQSFVLVN